MKMTFSLDGRAVSKKLSAAASACSDFTVPFNLAADRLLKIYSVEHFEGQGSFDEKWRPLAAATLKMRARRTGYYKQTPVEEGKILVWTGRLRSGFRKEVDQKSLRIFNDVPYFEYHQKGDGRHPPRRRMLKLTREYIEIVINEVNSFVRKNIL